LVEVTALYRERYTKKSDGHQSTWGMGEASPGARFGPGLAQRELNSEFFGDDVNDHAFAREQGKSDGKPEILKEMVKIDMSAIHRLRETLGKAADQMLPDLIDHFETNGRDLIRQAEKALETGANKELERFAHTLKGNGRNFGTVEFAEVAAMMETGAKQGNLEESGEHLPRLARLFEASCRALNAL